MTMSPREGDFRRKPEAVPLGKTLGDILADVRSIEKSITRLDEFGEPVAQITYREFKRRLETAKVSINDAFRLSERNSRLGFRIPEISQDVSVELPSEFSSVQTACAHSLGILGEDESWGDLLGRQEMIVPSYYSLSLYCSLPTKYPEVKAEVSFSKPFNWREDVKKTVGELISEGKSHPKIHLLIPTALFLEPPLPSSSV